MAKIAIKLTPDRKQSEFDGESSTKADTNQDMV